MSTKKSPLYLVLRSFIAAIIITALAGGYLYWYQTKAPVYGGDFSLQYRGQPWVLSQHVKPLTLFYVGYAKCPDVCPMSLSFAADAFKKLSDEERNQVQMVFLSVDHQHDTADSVADYAAQFYPSFIGLSGTQEQIDDAVRTFKVSYIVEENPKSYLGYSISHTDKILFLDANGSVMDELQSARSSDEIVEKIKQAL